MRLLLPKCLLLISVFILATGTHAAEFLGQKRTLTIAGAKAMVAACEAFAEKNRLAVSIVVVDDAGNMLNFLRMDGVRYNSIDFVIRKARTALETARPTRVLQDQFTGGSMNALPLEQFPIAGGLPVIVDGQLIGAIATGGASRDQEEQCSQTGMDVLLKK